MGDTPAQVAAFRVERVVLFGYVEAVHQCTVERVSQPHPDAVGVIDSVAHWREASSVARSGRRV